MRKHLLFIIIYITLIDVIDISIIYYISLIQYILGIYYIYKNNKNPVNPLSLFYLGTIFTNISCLVLISKAGTPANVTYRYIIINYINEASRIWLIGVSFICIGYEIAKNRSLPDISKYYTKPSIYNYLFIWIIAYNTNLFFHLNLFSFLAPFSKIIFLINIFGIILFTRIWVLEKNNKYLQYAFIACVLQTLQALFYSYLRLEIVTPIMAFAAGYFIAIGVNKIFTYRIIPFVIIFSIYLQSFSSINAYRSHFIDYFFAEKVSRLQTIADDEPTGGFLDRIATLAQITCIVNLVNKNGFYEGKASAPLVIGVIPRVLWPNKPAIQLGTWFAIEIGTTVKDERSTENRLVANNSVNMSIPGELYLDFGYIGVILGCLLTGFVMALLWNSTNFYSSAYNITGTLLGGYLLYQSFLSIGADLQALITFSSSYVTFFIIKKFL